MTAATKPADPESVPEQAAPDTYQKALAVNLDPTSFGSFAEIGAGQEVARWFLRVGGASGSVAKTVSAYDKEVSDDLYGAGTRYVSRPRVEAMLEGEWKSLLHQVGASRSATTRFFAYANTVAARSFAGTNDCHGWVGVRFQDTPGAEPSELVVHVNLRDDASLPQQEAVGILGVNLIHTLMAPHGAAANDVPARLFDGLADGRIEIDQVETRGRAFRGCDMPALHAALARDGRAEAVTIGADGAALAANEFFYKKAVVIGPATGDPGGELSDEAVAACAQELREQVSGNADVKDVLAVRLVIAEAGAPLPVAAGPGGGGAMITRHRPLYKATEFVRRYTQAPLRFALPLPVVVRTFDEAQHQQIQSRLLEGISRLFGADVRMLAYPSRRDELRRLLESDAGRGWAVEGSGPWITADQVRPAPPLRHLYEYLLASKFLVAMPPP